MSFFRCFGSLPLTCACPFSVLCPVLCLSVLCSLVPFSGSSLRPLARSLPVRSLVFRSCLACACPFSGSLWFSGSVLWFFSAASCPFSACPFSAWFSAFRSLRSFSAFSGAPVRSLRVLWRVPVRSLVPVLWCLRSLVPVLWCRVRVDGGRNGRRGDRVAAVQNGGAQPCSSLRGPIVRRPSRTRAEGYASSPTTTPLRRQAGDAAVIAL